MQADETTTADTENETVSTDADTPEAPEASAAPDEETDTPRDDSAEEADTFSRDYVEKLRDENAKYRQRAGKADAYAQRLHTELVRATGKLADPTDLPFDETHLDDPDALIAAVEDLISRKPHLATRRPIGEIGQGASASAATVDLAAILRQRAG